MTMPTPASIFSVVVDARGLKIVVEGLIYPLCSVANLFAFGRAGTKMTAKFKRVLQPLHKPIHDPCTQRDARLRNIGPSTRGC